ncbi:uncharacterized protein LOC102040349 [Geospiza fortis]|uniref:Uncharacterized protein LOC102040349 n=1 Tax=Geospiza fortis TaxID=48883 RepID=A0A6I9HVL5_GEOFO|nr:uncharacterized protein LOC102040349 [Geospiza fortis]
MALPELALTFFLALAPLLLARGQTHHGPVTPWVRQEAGKCKIPSNWDTKLRFAPWRSNYALNEVVQLSCVGEFAPSVPHIQCISRGAEILWNETPTCKETCQKPHWDSRLQLAPDQESYRKNEEVILSCPKGFQPPFTQVKCTGKVLSVINGKPIHREAWTGKDSRGNVIIIQPRFRVQCLDVLQVVPETLEVSSTSIKLNWTCRFPRMCQNIRARCQLEQHSSSNCEAEDVKVEEILQGWEGTFTCSPLQPFTVYSVTISLLPSTILYTRLITTKEMVPDKPEELEVDSKTGSLTWKALPSCKGKIIGYQLNITTMRAEDGSFVEFSQVLVNQSVSEYVPPHQTAGNKYLVTVQGLTAAGAGPASQLEFQTYIQGQPMGPWPGSAVTVVVVVVLLIPLSAGIIWFMLFRKKKALPSKAKEDQYTELQPYENIQGDYSVIETFPEKDAVLKTELSQFFASALFLSPVKPANTQCSLEVEGQLKALLVEDYTVKT